MGISFYPGALAVKTDVDDPKSITASAFLQQENYTLTIVLANKSTNTEETLVRLPDDFSSVKSVNRVISSESSLWKESTSHPDARQIKLSVPSCRNQGIFPLLREWTDSPDTRVFIISLWDGGPKNMHGLETVVKGQSAQVMRERQQ